MKLSPNPILKQKFLSRLDKKYSRRRSGIHISDILLCLRESYYRKVDPKPFTEKRLGYFVDGARRHKVLEELLGVKSEVPIHKWGIHGTIDILLDKPVEIKTTRARNALPDHYFRQLGYYAVLLGVDSGYLVIQRLLADHAWEFYSVGYSQFDIDRMGLRMQRDADLLRRALDGEGAGILPKVESSLSWKCRSCVYQENCRSDEGDCI